VSAANPEPELGFATTGDGWRLALWCYRPEAFGAERRGLPVLLCHGFGCNHLVFDATDDRSLARWIACRGRMAVAVELRGHGSSDRPRLLGRGRRFGWSFDDYVLSDAPALLAEARRMAGAEEVHWVGHSMGGLVGLGLLARGGSGVRSLVTLGSGLDLSGARSGFRVFERYLSVLERLPAAPLGLLARAYAPFVGRRRTWFERFNVWSSNCEPHVWRSICERGFHPVSAPVLVQLASVLEPGGLRSANGALAYLEALAAVRTPVLALAGDRDRQCPPDGPRSTVAALSSAAARELAVLGPESGAADHYGHFDLLIGTRAAEEVFARVWAWLDRHEPE
jgi:pimeloyl-ACP methyl ester carboxylesterase